MQFKIPHRSNKIQAITRVRKLLQEQGSKIAEQASDVKTEWKDNVLTFEFTAQKTHISGTLTVTDTHFEIYAKLPFMYRLFEGTIQKQIEAEVAKMGM